jgi:hypothetical protein
MIETEHERLPKIDEHRSSLGPLLRAVGLSCYGHSQSIPRGKPEVAMSSLSIMSALEQTRKPLSQALRHWERLLHRTAEKGPSGLFCMPNMPNCILFISGNCAILVSAGQEARRFLCHVPLVQGKYDKLYPIAFGERSRSCPAGCCAMFLCACQLAKTVSYGISVNGAGRAPPVPVLGSPHIGGGGKRVRCQQFSAPRRHSVQELLHRGGFGSFIFLHTRHDVHATDGGMAW